MSLLVKSFSFDKLPISYLFFILGSTIVKRLAQYSLGFNRKKYYFSAIDLYKRFCAVFNEQPWPTSTLMLEKWVANCIFGSTLLKQGQVKLETVSNYLSALKLYHINCQLSLKDFNNLYMTLIIKREKKLFSSKKQNHLPIIKDIFTKITKD